MIPDLIESDVCLLPMVTDRELNFWRLYLHYKNNLLFTDGGLMSQPNVYLKSMEIIEQRANKIAEENASSR